MRFIKKRDCFLDTKTSLEWSLYNIDPLPWRKAINACESMGDGWRLPSLEELLTLVNYDKYDPATELPKMLSLGYWSSTTYASTTYYAWSVYFHNGRDGWNGKSLNFYVRAVRGGRDE